MTDNLITILTFTYPQELAIVRGRLESEGIECFVQDELTVQVNLLYSNAIGGIKLQVRESDAAKALEILKSLGYIQDEDVSPSKFLSKLNSFTSKIPFFSKIRFEIQLAIIITIIIAATVTIIYFATLPSTYERLIGSSWCLDKTECHGKIFKPNSVELLKFYGPGSCDESIIFKKDSSVNMPGYNSRTVDCVWKLSDGILYISRADTFDFLYNGAYEIEFTHSGLILKSATTTLHCDREGSSFQFI